MIVTETKKMQINHIGELQKLDVMRTIYRSSFKIESQSSPICQIPKPQQTNPQYSSLQLAITILLVIAIILLGLNYLELTYRSSMNSIDTGTTEMLFLKYQQYLNVNTQSNSLGEFKNTLPELKEYQWVSFLKKMSQKMTCSANGNFIFCESLLL